MTTYKPLPWSAPARPLLSHAARAAAASLLRAAGTQLAHWAQRVETPPLADPLAGALEFYADAGAPEGALYVDGKLAGWLPGVRRL